MENFDKLKHIALMLLGCVVMLNHYQVASAAPTASTATTVATATTPATTAEFTGKQKTAIEKIIHDYLVENPQVLIEATNALQQQQQKMMVQRAQKAIAANRKELFNDPNSPVGGNPKGDVNLVEFFDYQCIHCREMSPVIDQLIKEDKNLRVIYKQFPIFGPNSLFAASAALAAAKQGKFEALHHALMENKKSLNQKAVLAMAKKVGINIKKLQKDMASEQVKKELADARALAGKLGLAGTPAFIIAQDAKTDEHNPKAFFIPGTASPSMLQSFIKQVR